jgi:serine phosphatase RsbU (regulator of sigma subunit)
MNSNFNNKDSFEYFIIDKPKGIVGGDFYLIKEQNNSTYIVLADSTGHGVSGGLSFCVRNSNFEPCNNKFHKYF